MLIALASVVVDHIQQHLQTGRVQGPYRHLELGDLPAGPVGPRHGRLATAGGPLPRIRPLRPPSTLTPLGKYPLARPRRRDVATPEGQAGGRCLNLLAALRLRPQALWQCPNFSGTGQRGASPKRKLLRV